MWIDDLSVNNVEIDNEHKQLFKLLDDFYKGIRESSSKMHFEKLVSGLIDYTKFHFAREEQYMMQIGYPDIESHKSQHELFVNKVNEFYDKIKNRKMILSLEVTNFLKNWLINHIKGTDQQYARFAKSKLSIKNN